MKRNDFVAVVETAGYELYSKSEKTGFVVSEIMPCDSVFRKSTDDGISQRPAVSFA
jgi:hypothetical protein